MFSGKKTYVRTLHENEEEEEEEEKQRQINKLRYTKC